MDRTRLIILLFGTLFVVGLAVLRVIDPLPVQVVRESVFDSFQRIKPREYEPVPVRIIDIDEASLREFGQWPWPRSRLAEMVDRLHAAGAAVVAFDIVFAEKDRLSPSELIKELDPTKIITEEDRARLKELLHDNDQLFADAMRRGNVVLGFSAIVEKGALPSVKAGFAYTGGDPSAATPQFVASTGLVEKLEQAATGIGSLNLTQTRSFGVVRRTPLVWTDGTKLYPALAPEALRVAQGISTFVVNAYQDDAGGVESVRIGGFEVPTTRSGELVLHYTRDIPERYISAKDVFDDEKLRELVPRLEGNIVLVGTSASGLFDIRVTSLGESVPGVMMHAQALEQIITESFLHRADWTQGLEFAGFFGSCILLCAATLFANPRASLLFGMALAAGIAWGCWWAYDERGILLDPSFPLFGGMMTWFITTLFQYRVAEREKHQIRSAFTHYVSPAILKEIERSKEGVKLGGETRTVTVLFTDVRDFTGLSESLSPDAVMTVLNNIFGAFSHKIVDKGGTIDKFIGDSVMAFWNAPLDQPDHQLLACEAILQMRAELRRMNRENAFKLPRREGRPAEIAIGFGLNTGEALIGNVGSLARFDYSAIGDAVNVASRAESASKELAFDLVVSETTAIGAPSLAFLDAGRLEIRGKTERVPFRILLGDAAFARSEEFIAFSIDYNTLIGELEAHGEAGWRPDLHENLLNRADGLLPGLRAYIERLAHRRGDFFSAGAAASAAAE